MKNLTYETAFQLGLLKKGRYYVRIHSYIAINRFLFIKYRKRVKWYEIYKYRDISEDGFYYRFDCCFSIRGERIENVTGSLNAGKFCDFDLKEIKKIIFKAMPLPRITA